MNRNVVATTCHIQCKGVLLNNKCLRHPMNRIQSKDHRILLCCFNDKIYIQSNGYDGLVLGYQS